MKTLKEVFGTSKPIIALLHLRELPGDPGYVGNYNLDKLIACAGEEMEALQRGGVDGILFSNEFSFPYIPKLGHVTTAAMAYIIGSLREQIRVPYGIHAIADPIATIELAAATGAQFVRGVFTGAYVGESGLKSQCAGEVVRRKMELRLDDLMIFYMMNSESDGDLSGRTPVEIAKAIVFGCQPQGLCISGFHAGLEVDTAQLEEVRRVSGGVPVFSNTGTKKENVAEKLRHCDGAFVGTAFKKDGKFENFVEYERVKEFMEIVYSCRGDL